MNCTEVQKQLSNLMDKSLDRGQVPEIEGHLASCSACSEAMERLAECRRLVSGLPAVEPPEDFTSRVMAEVREVANPRGLWERLFLPLQINFPLQATAVVLIAILAAYVYQKEPLQQKPENIVQPESKQNETGRLAPNVTQVPSTASETKEGTRDKDFADGPTHSRERFRAPAGPTPVQKQSSTASEAGFSRLEQSSPSAKAPAKGTPQTASPSEKQNASEDAPSPEKSFWPPEAPKRGAASSLDALRSDAAVGMALPADYELAIRLKEPMGDEKDAGDSSASGRTRAERRSLTSQEETRNLAEARQRAVATGQSQNVQLTIARNRYESFKKELADLGTIEMEYSAPELKNDAISKSSDRLRIKVTLLPPLAPQNPTPAQVPRR